MPQATITITNASASSLTQGRTLFVAFDHASLVSAQRSRADARDVRVVFNGVPLPTFVLNPNTASAVAYFAAQAAIPTGSNSLYSLRWGDVDYYGNRIPARDLSQVPNGAQLSLLPPFLFYDDFAFTHAGAWSPASPGDLFADDDRFVAEGNWAFSAEGARCELDEQSFFAVVWGTYSNTTPIRVRAELRIDSGVTGGEWAIRAYGDSGSAYDGYEGEVQGTTQNVLIDHVVQATATISNHADSWVAASVRVIDTGSATDIAFRIAGETTLNYSDAGATWNEGVVGLRGAGSTAAKYLTVRRFWVERLDAALDNYTTSVTIPSAALPSAFDLGVERVVDRARASFFSLGSRRSRSRSDSKSDRYRLSWSVLPADEAMEACAWFRERVNVPTSISLPGVSGTFAPVAGSLRLLRESAGVYSLSMELEARR